MSQASFIQALQGLYRVITVKTEIIPPPYTPLEEPGSWYTCVVQRYETSPDGYNYKWLSSAFADSVVDVDSNEEILVQHMSNQILNFFNSNSD